MGVKTTRRTHVTKGDLGLKKLDILTLLAPRAPFYVSGAPSDIFRELLGVLGVRGGVVGLWNRNIGHERLVPEPHAYSVHPPVAAVPTS